MSYDFVFKCKCEVSDLVMQGIERCSIDDLAFAIGVDERTIRRWRDGIGEPRYLHYRALCKFLESEGEDDSPSDFFKGKRPLFRGLFLWAKTP